VRAQFVGVDFDSVGLSPPWCRVDSITQAALGTAVSYACWSRPLGRKALPLGFALGTLPDLDIVAYPLLDEVQRLYWHRGESHSIWFLILGSWLSAWLLRRIPWTRMLSWRQAYGGVFAVYSTHVLIDLFTVYGTQLLAPFSRHGFGTNNFFIIDPLFTLPLLIGITGALLGRSERVRRRINVIGLTLATAYTGWSFISQGVATRAFAHARVEQGINAERTFTSATAFNTVLWRQLIETDAGFLIGYWSWFDDANASVKFKSLPRRAADIEAVVEARSFGAVDWFSQGWWTVVEVEADQAVVVDLRFGEIPTAFGQSPDELGWPFAWEFDLSAGRNAPLVQVPRAVDDAGATLRLLWRRIRGDTDAW